MNKNSHKFQKNSEEIEIDILRFTDFPNGKAHYSMIEAHLGVGWE